MSSRFNLKRLLGTLAALCLCASIGFSEEFKWPASPCDVTIGGDIIPVSWQNSRPVINRQDAVRLFNVSPEGESTMDLIDTLSQIGWDVRMRSGVIQLRNPKTSVGNSAPRPQPGFQTGQSTAHHRNYRSTSSRPSSSRSIYSRPASPGPRASGPSATIVSGPNGQPFPVSPPADPIYSETARATNRNASSNLQQYQRQRAMNEAMAPKLTVSSTKYVAETGFVRAFVVIRNDGGGPSQPCSAVGQFIDWFGTPYAEDIKPLGSLAPGESVETTFFSMLTDKEASQKSDKITCRVTFK